MSERDDNVYLKHILDAIKRIEEYLYEVSQDVFREKYLKISRY